MYCYGGNNPVRYVDPDGNAIHILVGVGIGFALGTVAAWTAGGDLKHVVAAAAGGAVTGGLAAATCGMSLGLQIAGSAMASTAGYCAEKLVAREQATPEEMAMVAAGGAAGAIAGAVIEEVAPKIVSGMTKVVSSGSKVSNGASSSKSTSAVKIHGNSLETTKPAQGYALKDKTTKDVLKYGETTQGEKRYTKKYLNENNAYMDFQAKGSKREMHNWQHEKILDYKSNNNGQRPPLNKSDW